MDKKQESKSDYKKFIEEKHKRLFNTSDEIIFAAVNKASGLKAISKERIVKGEANEVYAIKVESGQEFIIRISHSENYFERERWAIAQCRLKNIPVPKVLLVEEIKYGDKPLTVCVEEKLPGVAIDEMDNLLKPQSKDLLKELLRQAGQILYEIHSVPVKNFGGLLPASRDLIQYGSAEAVLKDDYINREAMLRAAKSITFDPKIIERAIKIMLEKSAQCSHIKPTLIHNDFGPKHLLIDKNMITGVIDFENAEGGDPVREFARWDFYFGDKYPLEYLKDGYQDKSLFGEDFKERLKIWKIHVGLSSLRYYIDEKNTVGIELAKKRLIESTS